MGMGMGGMGMSGYGQPMFQPMYQNHQPQQQQQEPEGKGKGRLVELDDTKWEEQFAQLEVQDKVDEKSRQDEATAADRELDEMDKALHSETNEFGDFESIWKGI